MSFTTYLLIFSTVVLPQHFIYAADSFFWVEPELGAFIVGSEDNPSPGGSSVDRIDMINQPRPSIPLDDGGRKLNEHRQLRDIESSFRSVDRDSLSLPLDRNEGTLNSRKPRVLVEETCVMDTTFLGLNYTDNLIDRGVFLIRNPADPHGAVGRSRVVAVVNQMLEVRRKDGTLTFRSRFQDFYPIESGIYDGFLFSPKVIYDEREGRFLIFILQQREFSLISRVYVAVSAGEAPDAAGDWYLSGFTSSLGINGDPCWADYPGIELDEDAIYITANMFRFSDNVFRGVLLFLIKKRDGLGGLYNGSPSRVIFTDPYQNTGMGTPQTLTPTQIHGANGVDGSVGTFFLSVTPNTTSVGSLVLQYFALFNPLSDAPVLTFQAFTLDLMNQSFLMPKAPQLGTTVGISTSDIRIVDAVWRNNKLWAVLTINPTNGVNRGQATAFWVRCRTVGGTLIFEAQGELGGEDIAAGAHTFYPSVAVNKRNVVAYGYGASSPTTYVGAYVSAGTSDKSFTVKSGLASFVRNSSRPMLTSGENIWGRYSSISVDPSDGSFWVFNQYAETPGSPGTDGDGRWGTAWGRLVCSSGPTLPPVLTPVLPPTIPPAPPPTLPPVLPPLPPPTLPPVLPSSPILVRPPSPAPLRTPTTVPASIPTRTPCGLLGLSIFCPFTLCGILGSWLGFCNAD